MFPTLIKIYHNLVGFSTLHPESTTSSEMQRWNQKNTLSHITIDESRRLHKNGGFNFRPPCAELCCLSRLKCLLVATCTTRTEEVVLTSLIQKETGDRNGEDYSYANLVAVYLSVANYENARDQNIIII